MFGKKLLKEKWLNLRWPLIGGAALATLALGFIGFSKYFIALGEKRPFSNILYLALQLWVLESGSVPGPVPWELDLARFLAPLIAAYAALKALALIFKEQIQMLRVRLLLKHTIICGLGRKGTRLVQQFRQRKDRLVVIERDAGSEFINKARDLGAIILIGDATDPDMLRRARCHKAKHLISVCGSDEVNAAVATNARRLVPINRDEALTCTAHIVDPRLCNLLKEKEIEAKRRIAFRQEFFNIFDVGARFWLKDHPPLCQKENDVSFRPHLLLIGIGDLGESLLVQTARKWDSLRHGPGEKLALTIVDRVAELKTEYLCLRYPSLKKACDLKVLQMDIESPQFERADFLFDSNGRGDVTTIFICLGNESLGMSAALSLRRHLKKSRVPIVIRMSHEEGISSLLQEEPEGDENQAGLHSFNLLDRVCTADLVLGGTTEILAQAFHEDYVLEQQKIGQTSETNPALVSWENLPETLKESNRSQADHVGAKLRAVGCGIELSTDWREAPVSFSTAEIELMARMEHDRWLRERRKGGWKSGLKKISKRRSPYLVPWDELTEDIKERDRAFVRDLPAFLAGVGFRIRRLGKGHPE